MNTSKSQVALLKGYLKGFQGLQQQRIYTYQHFEKIFEDFVKHKNIELYENQLMSVTATFQEISTCVREIENKMNDEQSYEFTKWSSTIRNIQFSERDKLSNIQRKILVEKHLISKEEDIEKQYLSNPSLKWQQEKETKEVLRGETLAILERDLKVLKKKQSEIINTINEYLEEIRYEIDELENFENDKHDDDDDEDGILL